MGLLDFFRFLRGGSIEATVESVISLYWGEKEMHKDADEKTILGYTLNRRAFAGVLAGNPNVSLFDITRGLVDGKNESLTVLIFYILMVESDSYRKTMIIDPEYFTKEIHKYVSRKITYRREDLQKIIPTTNFIAFTFKLSNF